MTIEASRASGDILVCDRDQRWMASVVAVLQQHGLHVRSSERPDFGRPFALAVVTLEERHELLPCGVVASLDVVTPLKVRQAFEAGAYGVIDRFAPADEIAAGVLAALRGQVRLPLALMRRVLRNEADSDGSDGFSSVQQALLDELLKGASIGQMAATLGYSERSAYRLLNDLYRKIGAHSREEAIAYAARRDARLHT